MARSSNGLVVVIFALLIVSGEARKKPDRQSKRKDLPKDLPRPTLPTPVSPPVQVPKVFLNLSEQLYHEAMAGNYRQCSTIIATGGTVDDAVDENGRHALYWAAVNGHYAVTALLLRNGANACAVDKTGQSIAQAAEAAGRIEISKMVAAACPRYREQLQLATENPLRFVALDAETFWHNMCTSNDGSCFLWDQSGHEQRAAQARYGAIGSLKANVQLSVCQLQDDAIFDTLWRMLVRYFSVLGNMMDVTKEMIRLYRVNGQLMQTERFFLDGLLKRHSMRDVEENILRTMEPRRGIDLVFVRACLTLYLRNLDQAFRDIVRPASIVPQPPPLPVLGPSSGIAQCDHPLLRPFCNVTAAVRAVDKLADAPAKKPTNPTPAAAPRKSPAGSTGSRTTGGLSGITRSNGKPPATSTTGVRPSPPQSAFVNNSPVASVHSLKQNASAGGNPGFAQTSPQAQVPGVVATGAGSADGQLASPVLVSLDWLLQAIAASPLGSAWTDAVDAARQLRHQLWGHLNATLPAPVVAFMDFSPTVTATVAFVRSLNGREALFLSTVLVLIVWTLARFLVKPVMMRFETRSRKRVPRGKKLSAIVDEMVPVPPLPPAEAKPPKPEPTPEPERPEDIERRRAALEKLCLKKIDRRWLDRALAERKARTGTDLLKKKFRLRLPFFGRSST
eukprot:TRINITY_DN4599_c0_g1_i1.p1 TRINITY_DN4599_c0_g1~~TRINITY_DN4599_c0_g1_i1.p1  ORF type:complete len:676 (+),score=192.63 TRINITY_DN4599_c0_g1_i1:140-2167(+)